MFAAKVAQFLVAVSRSTAPRSRRRRTIITKTKTRSRVIITALDVIVRVVLVRHSLFVSIKWTIHNSDYDWPFRLQRDRERWIPKPGEKFCQRYRYRSIIVVTRRFKSPVFLKSVQAFGRHIGKTSRNTDVYNTRWSTYARKTARSTHTFKLCVASGSAKSWVKMTCFFVWGQKQPVSTRNSMYVLSCVCFLVAWRLEAVWKRESGMNIMLKALSFGTHLRPW